ncbi:amidophosphoribosyltransferase [candidate division KSB3 bacterium]|uniref:Amidophosphoribosyltransferase n=1 Tax=candidate division KSB3 bacterium TaxID=2044937 RepID=A0A9D5JT45_9BACT|nr:amidophosphoribosyltransferase [candidate division KSB3 bacterium]MBD3323584.1 amidophosphoribosyltransferase [candidate division KSB3 bacterium]
MCGIVGFYGQEDVIYDLVSGLTALQHRGQDSAGVVTFNKTFHIKKGLGLVSNVFREKNLKRLTGNIGIGHVRYTTQGANELQNVQPFAVNYPFGLAMVHNGNVINFKKLRKSLYEEYHRLLETSNDLELLLYTLAAELEQNDLKHLSVDDLFNTIETTQSKVNGAYSTITVIANRGCLVFNDPYGIRPLIMGIKRTAKGVTYGFASESTCFDYLGYETVEDLAPGQTLFIDREMKLHHRNTCQKGQAFCIFEYIYFAREDSIIHNRLVASERVRMGKMLAKNIRNAGLEPDIVIDVPSSAYFFASSLAEELNIPYRRGLSKNNHIGRSFISPTQKERESIVRQKLNPIKEIIRGKKVAVVDDSIVRGTTSKHIIKLLRQAGASSVYFISAAPPIKHPCIYGVDMAITTELIAGKTKNLNEIADYLEADALVYQSLEDLQALYHDFSACYACFSGTYPTGDSTEILKDIEQERLASKK